MICLLLPIINSLGILTCYRNMSTCKGPKLILLLLIAGSMKTALYFNFGTNEMHCLKLNEKFALNCLKI